MYSMFVVKRNNCLYSVTRTVLKLHTKKFRITFQMCTEHAQRKILPVYEQVGGNWRGKQSTNLVAVTHHTSSAIQTNFQEFLSSK